MGLLVPAPRPSPGTGGQYANFSGRPATTWGTLLTASATPHTEGADTEILAAASNLVDAFGIIVGVHGLSTSATVTAALINVKIGASFGQTIIPNLLAGFAPNNPGSAIPQLDLVYYFPIFIPRGTRIGASLRALVASETARIRIELMGGNPTGWYGAGVETLGADTAASRGTAVTPGAASEGSFTAIGTTGRNYRYVLPAAAGNPDVTMLTSNFACDLGVSGTLLAGLENFEVMRSSTTEWNDRRHPLGRHVEVASGTALQARLQGLGADIEAKYVCIYGVY